MLAQQVVYMLLPLLMRDDSQWTSPLRPTLVYIDFPMYVVDWQLMQWEIRAPNLLLSFAVKKMAPFTNNIYYEKQIIYINHNPHFFNAPILLWSPTIQLACTKCTTLSSFAKYASLMFL